MVSQSVLLQTSDTASVFGNKSVIQIFNVTVPSEYSTRIFLSPLGTTLVEFQGKASGYYKSQTMLLFRAESIRSKKHRGGCFIERWISIEQMVFVAIKSGIKNRREE